MAFIVIISIPK